MVKQFPERIRQIAIAAFCAFVLGAASVLSPLDVGIWNLEAKLAHRAPTQSIGLVGIRGKDANDPEVLAAAISSLDKAGANRLFIDVANPAAFNATEKSTLGSVLNRVQSDIILVERITDEVGGGSTTKNRLLGEFSADEIVSRRLYTDVLGFVWKVEPYTTLDGRTMRDAAIALADSSASPEAIHIDYAIDLSDIPRIDTGDDVPGIVETDFSSMAGLDIVLSDEVDDYSEWTRIPGQGLAPVPYVTILAAESARADNVSFVPWYVALLLGFVALSLCVVPSRKKAARKLHYALLVASLLLAIIVIPFYAIIVEWSACVALVGLYGMFRSVSRYRRRHLLIDEQSGLPNLNALNRDLEQAADSLLVALRVESLERFTSLLPESGRKHLYHLLAQRLRIGQEGARVYAGSTKLIMMLLPDIGEKSYETHFSSLQQLMSQTLEIDGHRLDVQAVFGLDAPSERSAADRINSVISAVDEADPVRRPVVLADPHRDKAEEEFSLSMHARLKRAIETGDIRTVYQPKFDLRTGAIVSAEALSRWTDPERGEVPPSIFVAQCEKAGRIGELTMHTLRSASHAANLLRETAHRDIPVAVNVSSLLLGSDRLLPLIRTFLRDTQTSPSLIILEFTETAKVSNFGRAREDMAELRRLGFTLSIDDFGVGENNLETLLELPFQELKIDRMFVGNPQDADKASAIIRTLTRLGESQGITIVAEGIEDRASIAALIAAGCFYGQGFALGKPMEINRLQGLLDENRGPRKLEYG